MTVMARNHNQLADVAVSAKGGVKLPDGMTVEEAERLAREADAAREQENES